MKLPTFPQTVITMAKNLIKGTDVAANYPNGLDLCWLNHLMEYPEAQVLRGRGKQRPLELDRDRWTTSRNTSKHYDMLAEEFVRCGISVPNPRYVKEKPWDPKDPNDIETQQIIHVPHKMRRVCSCDETHFTLDMKEHGRSTGECVVLADSDDDGQGAYQRQQTGSTHANDGSGGCLGWHLGAECACMCVFCGKWRLIQNYVVSKLDFATAFSHPR